MITKDAVETAKRVLTIEADAIKALIGKLDGEFGKAVDMICTSAGRVVVCGMGKSGIIGQKIASTLASTGTPAFFLHPAEGVHGDIGMLMKNDVLIAISNSGETEELIKIIPIVKRMGVKMIAMTGRKESALGRHGDVVLDVGVAEEACPMGLAPTASTTAALAMGDALAVALIEKKGFREEDFAFFREEFHSRKENDSFFFWIMFIYTSITIITSFSHPMETIFCFVFIIKYFLC